MLDICSPALIYIVFSLTQIIIDIFQGMYNTAFMKLIVATLITILLDALCKRGLDVISWIIVFIPFIFMTVIVSVLLYIFGLNSDTGTNNKQVPYDFSNGNLKRRLLGNKMQKRKIAKNFPKFFRGKNSAFAFKASMKKTQ